MNPKTKLPKTAVVALGGNSITRQGEKGTIAQQFAHTRQTAELIAALKQRKYRLVITHGNGPQVGHRLIAVEAASGRIPDIPLGVLVADTQGGMGYMIKQSIGNVLKRRFKMEADITPVLTQVIVDRDDEAILNPTKPIGPFYDEPQAKYLADTLDWHMVEDAGRGWRRVVPSPQPLEIVEQHRIKLLLDEGYLVVACGGGGIPVYKEADGWLEGVDGVVDKDRASAVLARNIDAELLVIVTDVDRVAIHFNKPQQEFLDTVGVRELRRYQREGHFPPGSMGPKIEAALDYMGHKRTARKVIITSPKLMEDALKGQAGTTVVWD